MFDSFYGSALIRLHFFGSLNKCKPYFTLLSEINCHLKVYMYVVADTVRGLAVMSDIGILSASHDGLEFLTFLSFRTFSFGAKCIPNDVNTMFL